MSSFNLTDVFIFFTLWKCQHSLYFLLQRTEEDTGQGVRVAGDGRFDSPGWSARYCNYFIQVNLDFVKFHNKLHFVIGSCFKESDRFHGSM